MITSRSTQGMLGFPGSPDFGRNLLVGEYEASLKKDGFCVIPSSTLAELDAIGKLFAPFSSREIYAGRNQTRGIVSCLGHAKNTQPIDDEANLQQKAREALTTGGVVQTLGEVLQSNEARLGTVVISYLNGKGSLIGEHRDTDFAPNAKLGAFVSLAGSPMGLQVERNGEWRDLNLYTGDTALVLPEVKRRVVENPERRVLLFIEIV